ncbi:MAG TPA: hypothetical protein ENH34_05740 [Phycisphaerales bacterium]|nr:hypothetical protein [Phycisphaerales bacterium]
MPEELLSVTKVMARLAMGRTTFYRWRPKLIAFGLQEVRFGKKSRRFRASSLDRCIKRMSESEAHLKIEQPNKQDHAS